MAKTVADLIVERLISWGVNTVFGLPGDGINGLFEALRTHQDQIRFIQVRHEEAAAFAAYGYACALYGHFGQGGVHTRIDFDLVTKQGIITYRSFLHDAADLVLSHGGSLSGEHGDGQSRGELLPKMFGPELMQAFREFKRIWDPEWKMNPGKVIDAYHADENLRLGIDYHPPQWPTHFRYPGDDHGSFSHAIMRCVGVGECRREHVGTMCPSYRVIREEMHSTRGRARLLFEMLQGDPLTGGWRSEHVREALDLCLSCKGCKSDCPMQVDMATYKAEFLSHHYAGRIRPRQAYAMGLIYWWARLAALMPSVANVFTQTPGLRRIATWLGGIAPQRRLPAFAPQTFTQWFRQRGPRNVGHAKVLLWPDTFNNHFFPAVGQAAVEVLEAAGYQVDIPAQSLCCGRPLYDFGRLTLAKSLLRQIIETLRPQIEAGVPIVGLEPSCVAVFRDELGNLFPNDEDARRLSERVYLLSEFLVHAAGDYQPPHLHRQAIVHGHCHHKAIMGMDAEVQVLSKLGLDYHVLDSGCCGIAGSFGFEAGHYDVSLAIGEHELLPAVRQVEKDTLIIADGFSCREQIAQTTDRQALHLAQVLQMALHDGPSGPASDYPETQYLRQVDVPQSPSRLMAAALVGVGLLAGGLALWAWRQARRY